MVSSPASSQVYQTSGSHVFQRRHDSRTFEESIVRQDRRPLFSDISLAKSGFYNPSPLGESPGIGRGLGSLPDDRIRKIAKEFVSFYGSNGELPSNSLYRIQREAYEKCSQKPQFNDDSVKQLSKVMDQNFDSRVTEDDVVSLARRYLSCNKKPITYTPMVQERLAVARRLFQQFDV